MCNSVRKTNPLYFESKFISNLFTTTYTILRCVYCIFFQCTNDSNKDDGNLYSKAWICFICVINFQLGLHVSAWNCFNVCIVLTFFNACIRNVEWQQCVENKLHSYSMPFAHSVDWKNANKQHAAFTPVTEVLFFQRLFDSIKTVILNKRSEMSCPFRSSPAAFT